MANDNPIQDDIAQSGNTSRIDDSLMSRALTAVFSISLFAAVGALLGHKLGKISSARDEFGNPNTTSSAPRILAWIGGLVGGFVALGSQPQRELITRLPPVDSDKIIKPALTEDVPPTKSPLPRVEGPSLETQGKIITTDMVREHGV